MFVDVVCSLCIYVVDNTCSSSYCRNLHQSANFLKNKNYKYILMNVPSVLRTDCGLELSNAKWKQRRLGSQSRFLVNFLNVENKSLVVWGKVSSLALQP